MQFDVAALVCDYCVIQINFQIKICFESWKQGIKLKYLPKMRLVLTQINHGEPNQFPLCWLAINLSQKHNTKWKLPISSFGMNPPHSKTSETQSYVNFTKIASSGTKQTSSGHHTFDQIFNTCTINAYPPPPSKHHWGNSIPNRRHFVGEDDGGTEQI